MHSEGQPGCHGVLRKGATGKNLEPHWSKKAADGSTSEGGTLKLGTNRLEKIMRTPVWAMPKAAPAPKPPPPRRR
jgi:hypothetical protein